MDQMICYNCFKELGSSTNFCRHCGFPVAQDWEKYPHALHYGTVIGGRYITGRVLGQGLRILGGELSPGATLTVDEENGELCVR